MKAVLNSILLSTILLICTACPDKLEPKDTVVWIDNISDERVTVFFRKFNNNSADTVLINTLLAHKSPLDYIYKEDMITNSHASKIIEEFNASNRRANISEPGKGFVYFVANVDSLEKYSWDKIVQDYTGITTYYIDDYSDYEKVNFRLRYPKK